MINHTLIYYIIIIIYSFIFYGLMNRFHIYLFLLQLLFVIDFDDIFLIYDEDSDDMMMMLNVMMLKYYTVYYIDDETI